MIPAHTATTMWAVHDTVLDVFGFPHATEQEATLARNRAFAHLPLAERDRLFPVERIAVTLEPWRLGAVVPHTQAALFAAGEVLAR